MKPSRSRERGFRMVLGLAFAVVAGCSLNRGDWSRKGENAGNTLARSPVGGTLIQPRMCKLTVVILSRPIKDDAVNGAIWDGADEQAVAPDVRGLLQSNGLRIGVITGSVPTSIEQAMHDAPPRKVDPAEFVVPEGGDGTLISLAEALPSVSIFLNRDGAASGKDYKDASGWLRVTSAHDGPTGVALKLTPELHHGPLQRNFNAAPNPGAGMNSHQFLLKDGQQEESFRELTASVTVHPGQIVVIGADPSRRGNLGSFLMTQTEQNSDRVVQKVVAIWAERTNLGEPGSQAKPSSRLTPVEMPDVPMTPGPLRGTTPIDKIPTPKP
jgi:hypothetical protein